MCAQAIEVEAMQMARDVLQGADQTIHALRDVLAALRAVDGSKTLIVMSEGFVAETAEARIIELGALAASARTSLYALQLDDQLFDMTERRMAPAPGGEMRAHEIAGGERLPASVAAEAVDVARAAVADDCGEVVLVEPEHLRRPRGPVVEVTGREEPDGAVELGREPLRLAVLHEVQVRVRPGR